MQSRLPDGGSHHGDSVRSTPGTDNLWRGEKDNSNLFQYIDHLSAFTSGETFSSCRIDTFTPGQERPVLSCEYWATGAKCRRLFFHLFFPPTWRASESYEPWKIHVREEGFLSLPLSHRARRRITPDVLFLPVSLWEKFISDLSLLGNINACSETCEIWLACLCLWIHVFVNKTFIFFYGFLCWTLSFISGVVWKINAVAIQCLLLVFHCYSKTLPNKSTA